MKKENHSQNIREWWHAIGVALPTYIVLIILNISMKWKHSIGATIMVFYVIIWASRDNYRYKTFWMGLTAFFLLHAIGMVLLNLSLPETSLGFRGIPLIIFGMGEVILIFSILNRHCNRKRLLESRNKNIIEN
jgi:hypothetical protein